MRPSCRGSVASCSSLSLRSRSLQPALPPGGAMFVSVRVIAAVWGGAGVQGLRV